MKIFYLIQPLWGRTHDDIMIIPRAATFMHHVRQWVTPQNIIALLLFLAGLCAYRYSHTKSAIALPEPPQFLSSVTDNLSMEREITLVSLQDSLSSPRIVLIEQAMPLEPSQAVHSIINALQAHYPALWPEGLELRQVYSSTLLNGQNSLILNFSLESHPSTMRLSVQQERAFYNSIKQTLARNGYQQFFILINDELSPVFIHYISLPEQLR